MASNKQRLLAWFYRQGFPEGELRFDDQLVIACEQAIGKNAIDAAQYASANGTRYWNDLCNQSRTDVERGLRPLFRITDMTGRKAVWYPRLATSPLSARQKRAIVLSAARPRVLQQIELLTDREYEALGCLVTQLAGADRMKLTPAGNEGGIDLFARLRVPGTTHLFGRSCTPVRIVGQCKKYADRVTVDRIRDFITTMDLVRYQSNLLAPGLVPHWFMASAGPVVGWVVSHSGWQSGTQTLANSHGIVLSTSVDLAEVVAQCREFYPTLAPADRATRIAGKLATVLAEAP